MPALDFGLPLRSSAKPSASPSHLLSELPQWAKINCHRWANKTCQTQGHELIAAPAMGRDRRSAFRVGAVDFERNEEIMPMHKLVEVDIVHDVHDGVLALAHPQEGPGT